MKTVIILRGVSGSGKSTFAEYIQDLKNTNRCGIAKVSMDNYWIQVDGSYKFNPNLIPQAVEYCQHKFLIWLNDEETHTVIVDNTNTMEEHFQFYIDEAKKAGAQVFSIIVENRNDTENVHGVPKHTLELQEARLLNNIKLS